MARTTRGRIRSYNSEIKRMICQMNEHIRDDEWADAYAMAQQIAASATELEYAVGEMRDAVGPNGIVA